MRPSVLGPEDDPGAPASPATVFSYLSTQYLPATIGWRYLLLFGESLVYTAVGLYISSLLGTAENGIFSIALAAAAMRARFEQLLEENRDRIWRRHDPSWRTNSVTALSVGAIFAGSISAYGVAAIVLPEPQQRLAFNFALAAAGLEKETILTRHFADLVSLLSHNGLVLVSLMILSFLYRSFGSLLGLSWNACVWGLVLTRLVRRGLAVTQARPLRFIAISALAVLPHLTLEATGYVIGSMAAIFFSKGLLNYRLSDPRFTQIARACELLVGLACAFLSAAALFESQLTMRLLAVIAR